MCGIAGVLALQPGPHEPPGDAGREHGRHRAPPRRVRRALRRLVTLPTLLVSELARRDVTVVLSGDGGDEIFGGYNRHVTLERLWERVERIPGPARAALAATLRSLAPGSIDRACAALGRAAPGRLRVRHPGEKVHKLADLIDATTPADAYLGFVSAWPDPDSVVVGGKEPASEPFADRASWSGVRNLTEQIMLLDTLTYLPDDQLTKLDRASMSVGLEARVPFLDLELFKLGWVLPGQFKVRDGQGKWLLRQVLGRYVPPLFGIGQKAASRFPSVNGYAVLYAHGPRICCTLAD